MVTCGVFAAGFFGDGLASSSPAASSSAEAGVPDRLLPGWLQLVRSRFAVTDEARKMPQTFLEIMNDLLLSPVNALDIGFFCKKL
jgi:hypothetical protein